MNREELFNRAFEVATIGDVKTDKVPVIFTSCCKKHAQNFVAERANYALIHSTPAGAALEKLELFRHMSQKLAYLHWFYLSARFVIENTFTEEVLFFADLNNPSSTAFGIEIPLLYHAKPEVMRIANPLCGEVTSRQDWLSKHLMRPYVLSLANLYVHGPSDWNEGEDVLFHKFNESADGLPTTQDALEYRTELGLKIMLPGYLKAFGKFPIEASTQKLRLV